MLKSVKVAFLSTLVLCLGCKPQNEVSQPLDSELTDFAQNENQIMSASDRELYDRIQGKWSFVDPSLGDSLCYQFDSNGQLLQFEGTPLEVTTTGSYRVEKGQIIIRWGDLGGTETATAEDFSDTDFQYTINKHSDKKQVGHSMKFVRQKP